MSSTATAGNHCRIRILRGSRHRTAAINTEHIINRLAVAAAFGSPPPAQTAEAPVEPAQADAPEDLDALLTEAQGRRPDVAAADLRTSGEIRVQDRGILTEAPA